MKLYTDLEQSKKLAEILPPESADMYLNISVRKNMPPLMTPYSKFDEFFNMGPTPDFLMPCWSLAALLEVLPERVIMPYYAPNLQKEDGKYSIAYGHDVLVCEANSAVDACVEMIIKLHEQKLL